VDVATYLKELPFEALVRLMEEGKENSPRHPIEAHPQLLFRTLRLVEVEEDVHGGRVAEMVAENTKSPHESPAVRVQLGRGHIHLDYECALEPCEWQAKLDPLEDGGVHKEERLFGVGAIVDTYRFTFDTKSNSYVRIVFSPKYPTFLTSFTLLVRYHILVGGIFGGLY